MKIEDLKQAKMLWDYHKLNQPIEKKDVLLVLGSHDLRVAEYAAQLFYEGLAPTIIVSGGMAHIGDLLETGWERTEAEEFADVMIKNGVPQERILLEKEARNTGDNFKLSRKMLENTGIPFNNVLVLTKPYMERRAYATGKAQWPNVDITVTSPPIDFEQYIKDSIDPEAQINIMVGDLNRIIEYPKLGYQIEQIVPENVLAAYEALQTAGYNRHLSK